MKSSRTHSLQYGTNDHDPASHSDTALSAETIRGHESHASAHKTANIVNGSDNAFQIGIRVIEVSAERLETNDGAQDALIIAK